MKYNVLFFFIAISLLFVAGSVVYAESTQRSLRWSHELSAIQQEQALKIINEFSPRIKKMRQDVRIKVKELKNFCYASAEDHEKLAQLGKELQDARDALREALMMLDARLIREVGASLHGYRGRHHRNLEKATRSLTVYKYESPNTHHND